MLELRRWLGVLLLLLGAATAAHADAEIAHLLAFIEGSNCTFMRNGTDYTAVEARKHLENKYSQAAADIHNANEFIERIATKSSFTGKPYTVRCGAAAAITSHAWLSGELAAYRKRVK